MIVHTYVYSARYRHDDDERSSLSGHPVHTNDTLGIIDVYNERGSSLLDTVTIAITCRPGAMSSFVLKLWSEIVKCGL